MIPASMEMGLVPGLTEESLKPESTGMSLTLGRQGPAQERMWILGFLEPRNIWGLAWRLGLWAPVCSLRPQEPVWHWGVPGTWVHRENPGTGVY